MTISVAVVGATGRMGKVVVRLIEESDDFELAAAIDSKTSLDAALGADLIFDVTVPAVSQQVVEFAIVNGISVVVGTSGWSLERIGSIRQAVEAQPDLGVLIIPNFSIGSVLATSFAALAARFFDSIEIVEAHDVSKVDSPSGTAIRTAELIGEARANLGPVVAPHHDQRARGQLVASVPIHSVRMQGVGARQEVMLGGRGELLSIKHEAVTRDAYEAGILLALRAASASRGIVVGLDKLIDLSPSAE
ncbi:MAG TPA: 4-hydroxy-tetrahydrodipicolinate reductase [Galbitalea sp.]|jgi:4-hydroxy-tetrahydrodipicolinate reductase|nr:4-hydroxy-tetrahydrodipicolinate reductase [Galbitalea sp.]